MASTTRVYAGRRADERAASRRQTFLTAGRDLWAERGLAGLSVRGVCAQAGLVDRYFYAEFGSIEALAVAVAQDVGAELHSAMVAAGARGTTPVDRLRLGLQGYLEHIEEDPAILRIFAGAGSVQGPLADVRQQAQRQVATAIVLSLDPTQPVDEHDHRFKAAYFCVGGVTLLIERWLTERRRQSAAQLAAESVALCRPLLGL